MGTNYYATRSKPTVCSPIHIGKSSMGWMFLFHDQDMMWNDPPVVWHSFEDVRKWLDTYVGEEKTYVILNEYDEQIPLHDFYNMIEFKQKRDKDNPDNFSFEVKNVNGYRFDGRDFC